MNDDAISTPKANEIQLQFHADIQGQWIQQPSYAYCNNSNNNNNNKSDDKSSDLPS